MARGKCTRASICNDAKHCRHSKLHDIEHWCDTWCAAADCQPVSLRDYVASAIEKGGDHAV